MLGAIISPLYLCFGKVGCILSVNFFLVSLASVSQTKTITHEQFQKITEYLKKKKSASLLAIQISYYAGLRIGEVAGLSWSDVNLEEQQ
ncbi:MAG: tyrosine-type recombinase/integrase [Lachnospiraceae bacterium]|nr:tyrosine-type recombinase/integrase [Lachnospiraceae bacterium]